MTDFHAVLCIDELWRCLGCLWPGVLGQLKWRARCLLVSARALNGQRLALYQLRRQQIIDDDYAMTMQEQAVDDQEDAMGPSSISTPSPIRRARADISWMSLPSESGS